MPTFLEFFAGGGMARLGLGPDWRCLLANEIDPKKAAAYADNFGAANLLVRDVRHLSSHDLPGRADLAWASFPCQDLSLAGLGAGLAGTRSGTFFGFWRLIEALLAEGRAPPLIVLENVAGALTARSGRDFAALFAALGAAGYSAGAMMLDAELFLPQSRPRLFVVAARVQGGPPAQLVRAAPAAPFHPPNLARAAGAAPGALWWRLPAPAPRAARLADILEDPARVRWHSPAQTARLMSLMTPSTLAKVRSARCAGEPVVGGLYRRTRTEGGRKAQRAEVRFDGLAGCLRTPAGGSSRQVLIVVDADRVKTRLISPRETARLMGLPETYRLPQGATDAYHLTGDGLAVPAVRHLAAGLLEPLLELTARRAAA